MNLNSIINRDTYVISDHHFGHGKVEDFEPCRIKARKSDSVDTFEDMLIKRHNAVVRPEDNVLFLGDFAFNSPSNWASKLNGRKHLILGNHDRPAHQAYIQDFENVFHGVHLNINDMDFVSKFEDELTSAVIVNIDDYEIMFCHYPVLAVDEYATNPKTIQRLKNLEYVSNSFFIDFYFHGHLHSNKVDATEPIRYINTSCEVLDFTPRKIGELLDTRVQGWRCN